MKILALAAMLMLCGCLSPEESGIKTIVGAKLLNPGHAPIEYSVIIVENGKIKAAGPQASTPVPIGSAITRGMGMTVEPDMGATIAPGQPADLILKGATERRMHSGEWVQ